MNKASFYKELRRAGSGVFGKSLSQRQVDGCEAILEAGQGLRLAHLAHCLAEAYHETGATMAPVRETFARTDEIAVNRLERAWRKGQLTWVKTPYWRFDSDMKTWLGRGYVQLTHKSNYTKASPIAGVDLIRDPNAAMRPKIAAGILCTGCAQGIFTGKKLSDFDGPEFDHYNARAIVNGDKRKIGADILKYGRSFERALGLAGYTASMAPPPAPISIDAPKPVGWLASLLTIFRNR